MSVFNIYRSETALDKVILASFPSEMVMDEEFFQPVSPRNCFDAVFLAVTHHALQVQVQE